MHVTRINAIGKYNVSIDAGKINQDLEQKVPNNIQAIAHNYNHLHEQPTVFYAVALSLIAAGDTHDYTVKAAWTYVGIRIFHSLYQVLVNKVLVSRVFKETHSSGRFSRQRLTIVVDPIPDLRQQLPRHCWNDCSSCDSGLLDLHTCLVIIVHILY